MNTNNFLAVDTSSRYLTVLAVKGEKKVLRYLPDCALQHSVMLMDEIDKAFKEADLTPAECGFFSAVTGPGSFTGIRIGISTVKGFAVGTGKPTLAVTAFDLLAYNVRDNNFYTVIDAAHGHFYVCGFDGNKRITLQPCYKSKEEVENFNAPLYGFEELDLANYTKLNMRDLILPAVLAKCGSFSEKMEALYIRKSQAEENRR